MKQGRTNKGKSMRLRDACVLGGAFLVLLASSGCKSIHFGNGTSEYDTRPKTKALKSDPVTPRQKAQNEIALAQEYWQRGNYEIALEDVQKAIKLDSAYPEAYAMLGLVNEKINRLDQAQAAYEKSVKLAPNSGNMLNNYGAWLCRSGHPAEADDQFRKALADPFYKTPEMALGNAAACATKAGHIELAEGYDRKVLAIDPSSSLALQSMATIDFKRGDFMQARAFVERALAKGKPAPESLDLAARIEEKLGDPAAARGYRDRLSTEFPQYVPGQF
jgi:type IV pilus assembly protein PilF